MKFNDLYSLVIESTEKVIPFEDLKKYNYYRIGDIDNKKDAIAISQYLKDNNIDQNIAVVVEEIWYDDNYAKNITKLSPDYHLLVSKQGSLVIRYNLKKDIKKITSQEFQRRMRIYGLQDAKALKRLPRAGSTPGKLIVFDPMNEYNIDDEVKEIWRKAVRKL